MATPTTYAYVGQPDPSIAINVAGITTVPLSSVQNVGSNQLAVQFVDALSAVDKQNLDDFLLGYGFTPAPTGSGVLPIASIPRSIVLDSVANKNNYWIPVGDWFLDAAGTTTLEIDSGAGYVPQAFGADYSHLRRVTPPATVADAALGFTLAGGPVPAGWKLLFRWTDGRILVEPNSIAKVLVPANYAVPWSADGANPPNGVLVPELPGTQIEFWRETRRDGGLRGNNGVLRREGRRYLPFYRGAVDVFRFSVADFATSAREHRNHYRVCYYDPSTGARSLLSRDVIVVCSLAQADRVNGRTQRAVGSVWIE
jgi:hypothetical protein